MKKHGKDIEVGRCMKGKNERLGFSEREYGKNHMKIMNKENDWDHITAASVIKGSIRNVICKDMAIAIKVIKPGKGTGPFEACAEMISASGEVGVNVMVELCQSVLDGKGMPEQ